MDGFTACPATANPLTGVTHKSVPVDSKPVQHRAYQHDLGYRYQGEEEGNFP